ncbi:MAG TPA: hydroxymethylbilane synthase [Propionibacteriaceae bacterium]|nr:hydroxymethylbilane synthase [Propionibacteriaceae bacterium]
MSPTIRIGARTSPLARAQADHIAALLTSSGVQTCFVGITTTGDVDRRHLTEIGGTGVFATAVRDALRENVIDVAVHSLKDLPTAAADGLKIAAVPDREDSRDVLVGLRLADLAARGQVRIGTGAPRRALQLADYADRAGLQVEIVPIRGNVDTRLDLVRTGRLDAVVLAAAGLRRLGRLQAAYLEESDNLVVVGDDLIGEVLTDEVMLPAPGQGALGLEVTVAPDPHIGAVIGALNNPAAAAECLVERSFLARLEAGCTAPVGARAVVKSVRGKSLDLTLAAVIGRTLVSNLSEPTKSGPPIRVNLRGERVDPAQFGVDAADRCLSELHAIQRSCH